MFSRVRYFSFKTGPDGDRVPTTWILLAVLIIVLLAMDPPIMGMIFGSAYVISGLIITVAGRRNWKIKRQQRPAKPSRRVPVVGSGRGVDAQTKPDSSDTKTDPKND